MQLNCINDFLTAAIGVASNNSANTSNAISPSVKILLAAAIILILVIVIAAVAVILRKHFNNNEEPLSEGFLLSDLRKMHQRGELTDQELEATKALVIKKSRQAQDNNSEAKEESTESTPKLDINKTEGQNELEQDDDSKT